MNLHLAAVRARARAGRISFGGDWAFSSGARGVSTSEVAVALADATAILVDGAHARVTGLDMDGVDLTVVVRWPIGENVEGVNALV